MRTMDGGFHHFKTHSRTETGFLQITFLDANRQLWIWVVNPSLERAGA